MKRKPICLIIIMIITICISGCGKKLPEGMNQETYDTAVRALEIMDKYNDADIDAEEADNRLDALRNTLDDLSLKDEPENGEMWSETERNLFVEISITSFQSKLFSGGDTYSPADDLREELGLR